MEATALTTPALVDLCARRLEQELRSNQGEAVLQASTRVAVHALRCLPVPTCSLCSLRCPMDYTVHVFTGRSPADAKIIETRQLFCGLCYKELQL